MPKVFSADIKLHGDSRYVAKYYPYRTIFSDIMLCHEHRILNHLRDINGVPKVINIKSNLMVISYINARPIQLFKAGQLPNIVYKRLVQLVGSIHKKRVLHLDLRQRRNILIDEESTPHIVDFQSAIIIPQNAIFNLIFDPLKLIDKAALLRIKRRYFPDLLTARDRKFLKIFHFFRYLWIIRPFKLRTEDRV